VKRREDILVEPDPKDVRESVPLGVSNDDPNDGYVAFFAVAKGSLMGQAYLLTGDVEEARDLVQETLLRAWKNWPTVRSYEDPNQWARRILHNLAVSRWRRERLHNLVRFRAPTQVAGPDASHLDVTNALRLLPMDQRRALVLHDVAGLTVVEVAAEIGVPEGTVRSWLSRGRKALAKDLGIVGNTMKNDGGTDVGS
jgi:RNA polymerase sigma-70 factor (ECF subfamily)